MKVAIVKYNAGNIYSVYCAVKRLGAEAVITDDPAELTSADRVIFPGVGEARAAMDYLRQKSYPELGKTLADVICELKCPVLGICIGMQLLCRHSEEGDVDCLGVFDVPVERFRPTTTEDKVPQMGWNTITGTEDVLAKSRGAALFKDVKDDAYVYYVHSYRVPVCPETIATTTYAGETYSAALCSGNFWTTQFHPEKSGSVGEQIIRNFLNLI